MPRQIKIKSPVPPPAENSEQKLYSIVLQMGDLHLEESGETIAEAIRKLKVSRVIGRSLLTVKHLGKEYTFTFVKPMMLSKALTNKEFAILLDKRARQFLGEII